jgi:hypothetical protein
MWMLFFCLSLKVSAQQILTVHGVVSKKLSVERVSQVLISNLRSKDMMMSDEVGWFTVKATIGDTLLFSKADYTDQKIVITNGSDLPVYMQPVIHLATVNVQGESKKQELNDVMADYKKDGVFNNGKSLPVFQFLTSPLTGLYNLFGSDPGKARRFAAYSKDELEYAEIRRRYTLKLVKQVTNLPDSTAIKFMEYYTPSYEDLKGWNDYDLIKQIRRSYEYYDENKDNLDLQHLNGPALAPAPQPPKGGASE